MLLSEFWERYRKDKRALGYSPHTLKAYGLQMGLFKKYLGDIDISEITFEKLKQYLADETQHLKASSIGHRVRYLKSLFRYAYEEGFIEENPAWKLQEPKMGKRVPKALKEEPLELLRLGCQIPFHYALLEFLFASGCRIGEVHLLNKRDIDWQKRSAFVIGKGDKEREVYFTVRCSIWLKKYLETRTDNEECLFVSMRKPYRRMSIWALRNHLKEIAKNAGLDDNIYPHKLRHSFATHLLNNGAPLELIQSYLGHEKAETTRIYAQLSTERKREMYNKYF